MLSAGLVAGGADFGPSPGEIDIWTIQLQPVSGLVSTFERLIAADEIVRANKFRFRSLRDQFVLTRGALRIIVAKYLAVRPEAVQFQFGPHGKPAVQGETKLRFNYSHSGALAVFAIARDMEVGVDVERRIPLNDDFKTAAGHFSHEEFSELQSLPPDQRERAFYLCWTRKEAYVKATGEGLAGLQTFSVSLRPGEPARFIKFAAQPSKTWYLHNLEIAPDYAGALAYCGQRRSVRLKPSMPAAGLLDERSGILETAHRFSGEAAS